MRLWSAGSNAKGQLGTGDQEDAHQFRPALFEVQGQETSTVPGDVLQVACGANHTLVLLRSSPSHPATLWGAGDGSNGQLGAGPDLGGATGYFKPLTFMEDNSSKNEIIMIQASWETSFVVVRSSARDQILSFGSNDFGILGMGTAVTTSGKESLIVDKVSLDHLFSKPVSSLRVVHLKAGPRHVLAVLQYTAYHEETQREMLIGWGAGRNGQLEMRNPEREALDKLRADGPRRVPLPIRITTWIAPMSVVDMSVGYSHALVLLNDGSISQLGSNSKSQLLSWSGHEQERYKQVGCSWNNSFVALIDPNSLTLRSYGRNTHGQLGRSEGEQCEVLFTPPFQVRDFVCGSEHCLVIGTAEESEIAELWGWGWNEHGNLALGHSEDVQKPSRIPLPDIDTEGYRTESRVITGVWAGCGTSWVATR